MRLIPLAAAALVATLSVSHADAAMMTGGFAGTFNAGATDVSGVYFAPNTDLSGVSLTGTFSYDTSLFTDNISGNANSATSANAGALTISLIVNGFGRNFVSTNTAQIDVQPDLNTFIATMTVTDTDVSEFIQFQITDSTISFLANTSLNQSIASFAPDLGGGTVNLLNLVTNEIVSGSFSITNFSLSEQTPTATPEPLSASLLGLGLLGTAALRRRRTA